MSTQTCEHLALLPPDYPGVYCVYCRRPVAEVDIQDGQVLLKGLADNRPRKYLAVTFQGQQCVVEPLKLDHSSVHLLLKYDDRQTAWTIELPALIAAFHDPCEELKIT
jgi:hypothetical protein